MTHQYYGKDSKQSIKKVYFTGTDALKVGYLLCYDRDTTGGGAITTADYQRAWDVEKPSTANLHWLAGAVKEVGDCGRGGPGFCTIVEPNGALAVIYTEETTVTAGVTMLSLKPSDYEAGAAFEGQVIGVARQTLSAAGTCMTEFWGLPKTTPQARTHTATGRGYSPVIWEPYEATIDRILMGDLTLGKVYQTDFNDVAGVQTNGVYCGPWLVTVATGGGVTHGTDADGTLILTAGGTADYGPQMQLLPFTVTPAANKLILFECRAKVSVITAEQLFMGLATVDTAVFTGGVLVATDVLGFTAQQGVTTATKLDLWSEKAGVPEDSLSVGTMSTAYFKCGFVVSGITTLAGYYNGVIVDNGDIVEATHLPVAAMVPTIAALKENDAVTLTFDWLRVAYLT